MKNKELILEEGKDFNSELIVPLEAKQEDIYILNESYEDRKNRIEQETKRI